GRENPDHSGEALDAVLVWADSVAQRRARAVDQDRRTRSEGGSDEPAQWTRTRRSAGERRQPAADPEGRGGAGGDDQRAGGVDPPGRRGRENCYQDLRFPPPSLSLRWYERFLGASSWRGALVVSVQVA